MYDLEAGCWFWSLAFKLNMNRKEGRMHGHEKVQCIHRESKECKRCYSNAQFFFLGQRAEDELCWNNQKELTANTGVNEPVKEAESQKGQNEGIKKNLSCRITRVQSRTFKSQMYDLKSMFLSPKEKQETLLAGISEKH